MTTTPAVKAAADAIMQFETGGHCLPGQACQICDCGTDIATPKQLADERLRYETAAYYILTKALGDVDEMARSAYEYERSKNAPKHQTPAWEDLTETDRNPERTRIRAILASILGECPTCTWPHRETTGMVCQTCGTDYGDRTNQ